MKRRIRFLGFALAVAALTALTIFILDRNVPAQHLPWRKLSLYAPIGWATDTQLYRLALSPSADCAALVAAAEDFTSAPAPAFRPSPPCGWDKAQKVTSIRAISLRPEDTDMQCPLAAGSYIWMSSIDEAAQKYLGSPLKKIVHAGTYSCRRQVGNSSGAWSEHAFANAWDITGFELADGRVISVLKDWKGEDRARRKFLRTVRDNACAIFRVTLSPDFNDAHKDHFHVDMGPVKSCN